MKKEDNHLRRKRDFEIVFSEGRMVVGGLLMLKFCPIDPLRHPKRGLNKEDLKVAFVVTNKIAKQAVVRNRVRRMMREVFRSITKEKTIKTGYYLVFMAKGEAKDKKTPAVQTDMLKLLTSARLV